MRLGCKFMKMPNCSKKELKSGMMDTFSRRPLMLVIMYYYITLAYVYFQVNQSRDGVDLFE